MSEAPVKGRAIVVLDYDPAWPTTFESIRSRLEALLGDLVLEICHVGSTAVPGLCAKPKIDVDVVLRESAAIAIGAGRLLSAGYAGHGDKHKDGMWVFTTGRGSYGERVYLCAPGTATHENRLLFRDYLRARPEAAEEYGRLKRRLASETVRDWDHYTGGKSGFVADIVARAKAAG
ncbi:GrpB family protein [Dongia sp. agr-C8]